MSVGVIVVICSYLLIAILYGIFTYILIQADIELIDILENKTDIYLASIIIGLFWVITFPILMYNTFIKDNEE